MFTRLPLPFKILLWFFLNVALLVAGFGLLFKTEYRFDLDWLFASHAQQRVEAMRDLLVDDLDNHQPEDWDEVVERFADAYHVRLTLFDDRGGHLLGSMRDLPTEVRLRLRTAPREKTVTTSKSFLHTANPSLYWLVFGARVDNPRMGAPMRLNVIAQSDSPSMGGLIIDPTPWLRLGAAAVVLSVLFWLPLLRGITRSIGQVTHTAREIAAGRLDARVASRRRDELGVLAEAINGMAARLDGLLRGQKRFLGDVAHELCSPLARLQMTLGIIEQRADDSLRAYARTSMEKAEQMARLVDELLAFSRASLEESAAARPPVAVDIAAAAREAVAQEASDGAHIRVEIPPALRALADPEGLVRALGNLLRNALRYGGKSGPILLRAAAGERGKAVTISIADSGPGVPEDELPKLFDAFYRVDAARTRETGGVGLGLSIVKTVIEAGGGTVAARNRPEGGLEVTLSLPAAPAPDLDPAPQK